MVEEDLEASEGSLEGHKTNSSRVNRHDGKVTRPCCASGEQQIYLSCGWETPHLRRGSVPASESTGTLSSTLSS